MMTLYSPFDNRNIIWYISEVTPLNIRVHFPDSKLLKRFNYHWDSLHWWIVWSFVAIEWETKWFIWKIVKLSLPEKERMDLSESNYKNKELHPIWIVELLFSFDLLTYKAKRSIQDYPPVSSKVYVCSQELYINILKNSDKNTLSDELKIWETLWTNENVSLSANDIFSRHCAILWTTWWWKSYTIAKIIEELISKDNAKIVLLDATWEFSSFDWESYSEKAIFNNWEDSVFFSYKNFVFDDLVALFRPAWQVQLPKLDETLKSLKIAKISWDWKVISDETISSKLHIWCEVIDWILKKNDKSQRLFNRYCVLNDNSIQENKMDINMMKILMQMNEEFYWLENEIWGKTPYQKEKDNCSSLMLRIANMIYNPDAEKIFDFKQEQSESNSLINKVEDFYSNNKKLFRIDLSNIPENATIKEILVNAIWRYFLNNSKDKKYKDKPIIIIIDEAHLFLNKKVKDEYSVEVELNAFDRIAKECRKFWIFLCLSTQRPRDIPEWVLSQIWTFIVHRLINEKDKQAVENASSSYSKEFLSFLPSLWEWEAILMWVNFLTTLFLKIKNPLITPKSDTPRLFKL